MDIANYDVVQELLRHGPFVVYRGRRKSDQALVLLTTPDGRSPLAVVLAALERQFELTRAEPVAGLPRAYDFIRDAGQVCLVLEDTGLTPLRDRLGGRPLDLALVIDMAVTLCSILDQLHRRRLIHGTVGPTSIWIDSHGGRVQLLHHGLSPRVSAGAGARAAADAAPYMSPEQTGRMNRSVDHRTDF